MGFPTRDGRSTEIGAGGEEEATTSVALSRDVRIAIGRRVRAMRLAAGWTQAELGRPFSKGYISQIESGRVAPSLALISVIAARLDTSIQQLAPEIEAGSRPEDVGRLWNAAERLERHGERESALELLEQSTRLAAASEDPRLRAQSLLRYAEALRRAGRTSETLEMTTGAFEVYSSAGPQRQLGQCYHVAALAHGDRGDLERAKSCFEKALRHIPRREVGHSRVLIGLSRILLRGGLAEESARRARQAITVSHQHGDAGEEGRARLLLAEIMQEQGKPQEALAELDMARRVVSGLEDVRLSLWLRALEALMSASEVGDELERCLWAAQAAGEDEICVTLCSALVERQLASGSGDEAARTATIGIEHAMRDRDLQRVAWLYARQALAFAMSGGTADAAVALVRSRDAYIALRRPDALTAALQDIRERISAAAMPLLPLLETPPAF